MDWLFRSLGYFVQVLMPARFRKRALEHRATSSLDRMAERMEHPDKVIEKAAESTARGLDRGKSKAEGAATDAAARAEGKAVSAVEGGGDASPPAGVTAAQTPKPQTKRGFWFYFRWFLHLLLLALILWGLWWLNRWLGMERLLRSAWPYLHAYWLPLLFVLLYTLMWLGWWLWELTGPDAVGDDFPDLHEAWNAALDTLAEVGISIREVPLYLVVGQPESVEQLLFETADLPLLVSRAPRGVNAPLYMYATADAVFLTIAGASVLARQAQALVQQQRIQSLSTAPVPVPVSVASGEEGAEAETTAEAEEAAGPSEEDQRILSLLAGKQTQPGTSSPARSFLKNPAEVRTLNYRLQYLCKLLQRDRRPYAPINGVLVLVPYSALASDNDTSQTTTAAQLDLTMLSKMLQVRCPVLALVCDLDQAPGFRELLRRLPVSQKVARLGQPFPLLPDVEDEKLPKVVADGVGWLSDSLLPSVVYNLLRVETPPESRLPAMKYTDAVRGNARLYQLLGQLRERQYRLTRLLVRGLLVDQPGTFYFGGVFLTGKGQSGYAFLHGVFQRLFENQNALSWTKQAVSADRRAQALSGFLLLVTLAIVIAVPIVAYIYWPW